jgi:hypothetical protein
VDEEGADRVLGGVFREAEDAADVGGCLDDDGRLEDAVECVEEERRLRCEGRGVASSVATDDG